MDINATLANEPLVRAVASFVRTAEILVGGIFGFYLLSFIWRLYTYKRNSHHFKGMRHDLHHISGEVARLSSDIRKLEKKMSAVNKRGGR